MLARDLSDDHRARGSWQVRDRGMYPDVVQPNPFNAGTARRDERLHIDPSSRRLSLEQARPTNRQRSSIRFSLSSSKLLPSLRPLLSPPPKSDDEELAEYSARQAVYFSSPSVLISRPKRGSHGVRIIRRVDGENVGDRQQVINVKATSLRIPRIPSRRAIPFSVASTSR